MCGITGIVAFSEKGKESFPMLSRAIACLDKRGPDSNGSFVHEHVALGHTRLSVIDTSPAASQPMTDASGRYVIIFNGEFYNFREHRDFVQENGFRLRSDSDTEVLLYLYLIEKEKCLARVNGFFALAIYDTKEESLFIARDRFGVKPLLVYEDADKLFFSSEMKSLLALGIPKEIDEASLFTYLQLNYIPGPSSIFTRVKKLEPGHFLKITRNQSHYAVQHTQYYAVPFPSPQTRATLSYQDQQKKMFTLLDNSVQKRMVADVPLGAFLSGGTDSSIIAALASRHTSQLNTFSIGFRGEPMFDETRYANLVAKKCGTQHTVFSLTNDDLFDSLFKVLDYIDEPFADSSALAVYILSMLTRQHVTVALSGDGADELFGGYNKHLAELKTRQNGVAARAVHLLKPFWKALPQSRNSKAANKIRQLRKFSEGMSMTAKERYWSWAGYEAEEKINDFLSGNFLSKKNKSEDYFRRKNNILKFISGKGDMNDVLYTDVHLVLPYDMLAKVDLMSMANSLEVRTPFLDYEVVEFAFSLPIASKIDETGRKKILRDAFRKLLPEELYNRNKQGFEVPLLKWFRHELKSLITDDLLEENFIRDQQIFKPESVAQLTQKLFSNSPGDAVAQVWALIVFQYWWKKKIMNHKI